MKYTESHEWVDLDLKTGVAKVGITQFAQKELGDIVYVELPEVGKLVKKGDEAAVLESTKAAADVYAPVSGTIVEVNKDLVNHAELINQDPYKKGWIFTIKLTHPSEWDSLLTDEQS